MWSYLELYSEFLRVGWLRVVLDALTQEDSNWGNAVEALSGIVPRQEYLRAEAGLLAPPICALQPSRMNSLKSIAVKTSLVVPTADGNFELTHWGRVFQRFAKLRDQANPLIYDLEARWAAYNLLMEVYGPLWFYVLKIVDHSGEFKRNEWNQLATSLCERFGIELSENQANHLDKSVIYPVFEPWREIGWVEVSTQRGRNVGYKLTTPGALGAKVIQEFEEFRDFSKSALSRCFFKAENIPVNGYIEQSKVGPLLSEVPPEFDAVLSANSNRLPLNLVTFLLQGRLLSAEKSLVERDTLSQMGLTETNASFSLHAPTHTSDDPLFEWQKTTGDLGTLSEIAASDLTLDDRANDGESSTGDYHQLIDAWFDWLSLCAAGPSLGAPVVWPWAGPEVSLEHLRRLTYLSKKSLDSKRKAISTTENTKHNEHVWCRATICVASISKDGFFDTGIEEAELKTLAEVWRNPEKKDLNVRGFVDRALRNRESILNSIGEFLNSWILSTSPEEEFQTVKLLTAGLLRDATDIRAIPSVFGPADSLRNVSKALETVKHLIGSTEVEEAAIEFEWKSDEPGLNLENEYHLADFNESALGTPVELGEIGDVRLELRDQGAQGLRIRLEVELKETNVFSSHQRRSFLESISETIRSFVLEELSSREQSKMIAERLNTLKWVAVEQDNQLSNRDWGLTSGSELKRFRIDTRKRWIAGERKDRLLVAHQSILHVLDSGKVVASDIPHLWSGLEQLVVEHEEDKAIVATRMTPIIALHSLFRKVVWSFDEFRKHALALALAEPSLLPDVRLWIGEEVASAVPTQPTPQELIQGHLHERLDALPKLTENAKVCEFGRRIAATSEAVVRRIEPLMSFKLIASGKFVVVDLLHDELRWVNSFLHYLYEIRNGVVHDGFTAELGREGLFRSIWERLQLLIEPVLCDLQRASTPENTVHDLIQEWAASEEFVSPERGDLGKLLRPYQTEFSVP